MSAAQTLISKFVTIIISPAILVIFSAGALVFVLGLVQFLIALNKGGDTKDGRDHMLWGVAGMFIMVSVFGIIALISNTFGLGINRNGSYNPDTSQIKNVTTPCFGTGC